MTFVVEVIYFLSNIKAQFTEKGDILIVEHRRTVERQWLQHERCGDVGPL